MSPDISIEAPDVRSLRTYDRTKEIAFHPYFRGGISRFLWRIFMYRFTSPGRWFMALTFFCFLYGVTSLQFQIYVPLLYAAGVWLVAWLITIIYPPRADVSYTLPQRVAAGSFVPIKVAVSTKRQWYVELNVIPMRLPPTVESVPADGVEIQQLNAGDTKTVELGFIFHRRGIYSLKGFRLETSFPVGLLRAYTSFWKEAKVLVYPTFHRLASFDLPTGNRYQPGGVALASKIGESMEYIGNRDYREGDRIRDVDWKATARLTKPIIREYREEYYHRVAVVLDTFIARRNQLRDDDFERAVSISAAVSDYMARAEFIVDLFAAGPNLYHLTAGRSLAFQDQILDILACLEPSSSESFAVLEPEILENLSQLSSVIIVLLDWDSTRQAFVNRIRRYTGVKVIVVRDTACSVDPSPLSAELSLTVISKVAFVRGVGAL